MSLPNDPALDDPQQLARFEAEVMSGLKEQGDDPVLDALEESNAQPPAAASPAAAPAAPAPVAAPQAPAPQAASPAPPAPAVAATSAPANAPAAPADGQVGKVDWRAATFSAREDARQTRLRLEAAEAELARFRQASPPPPDPVAKAIQQVRDVMPEQAAALEALQSQVQELKVKAGEVPQPQEPLWKPVALPPELEEVVSKNDELAFYHGSKDHQHIYAAIAAADGMLYRSPAWQDQPLDARLQEAMRIAKAELARPAPPPPPDAAAAAAATAAAAPAAARPVGTLSDLNGGISPANSEPDFNRMTDDQVEQWLAKQAA